MWLSSLQTGALQRDSNKEGVSAVQVRKPHPSLHQLPNRSSDEWLIGEAKKDALLKAPVGVDPNKPPSTGWRGEILVCPSWASEPPRPPGPPRPLGSLGPPEPPGPPRSSGPPRPPRFYSNGKYEEDANITCTNQSESPCWILRVSLSGQAKKECSSCAGMYESTGLISMGRQVI